MKTYYFLNFIVLGISILPALSHASKNYLADESPIVQRLQRKLEEKKQLDKLGKVSEKQMGLLVDLVNLEMDLLNKEKPNVFKVLDNAINTYAPRDASAFGDPDSFRKLLEGLADKGALPAYQYLQALRYNTDPILGEIIAMSHLQTGALKGNLNCCILYARKVGEIFQEIIDSMKQSHPASFTRREKQGFETQLDYGREHLSRALSALDVYQVKLLKLYRSQEISVDLYLDAAKMAKAALGYLTFQSLDFELTYSRSPNLKAEQVSNYMVAFKNLLAGMGLFYDSDTLITKTADVLKDALPGYLQIQLNHATEENGTCSKPDVLGACDRIALDAKSLYEATKYPKFLCINIAAQRPRIGYTGARDKLEKLYKEYPEDQNVLHQLTFSNYILLRLLEDKQAEQNKELDITSSDFKWTLDLLQKAVTKNLPNTHTPYSQLLLMTLEPEVEKTNAYIMSIQSRLKENKTLYDTFDSEIETAKSMIMANIRLMNEIDEHYKLGAEEPIKDVRVKMLGIKNTLTFVYSSSFSLQTIDKLTGQAWEISLENGDVSRALRYLSTLDKFICPGKWHMLMGTHLREYFIPPEGFQTPEYHLEKAALLGHPDAYRELAASAIDQFKLDVAQKWLDRALDQQDPAIQIFHPLVLKLRNVSDFVRSSRFPKDSTNENYFQETLIIYAQLHFTKAQKINGSIGPRPGPHNILFTNYASHYLKSICYAMISVDLDHKKSNPKSGELIKEINADNSMARLIEDSFKALTDFIAPPKMEQSNEP